MSYRYVSQTYIRDYEALMEGVIIRDPTTYPHISRLNEFVSRFQEYMKNTLDIPIRTCGSVPKSAIDHPIGMMAIMEIIYHRAKVASRLLMML